MSVQHFPPGFVWGAATAAHQVEGGNWNNDWWQWEHTPGTPCQETSGDACDHYHRYHEDLDLLAGFGFNTYRFSLEWSRIEPEPGEFSNAALDHYRRVCEACRERALEPMVTFHHFTTPRWVASRGGWVVAETADYFGRFCERAAARLGDLMARACTLNEPNVLAAFGYRWGLFPPGECDPERRLRANEVLILAHRQAVSAIRAVCSVPVGMTLAMQDHQAVSGGESLRDSERHEMEDVFLEATRDDDFIGIQTYTRLRFGSQGMCPPEPNARLTQMGYEFWPDALEACLRRAAGLTRGLPLLVTENGIGTDDDAERIEYVERALRGVLACIRDNIEVQGYVYWSLFDNFEWAFGYRPKFGLVAVDRDTQKRRPKPSAAWLGAIARANALTLPENASLGAGE